MYSGGLPSTLAQSEITSHFIHTDFGTDGSIQFGPSNVNMDGSVSNAYLLNAVQHMTRYASMSNYINIPTGVYVYMYTLCELQ